jgi:hypothetical protein
MEAAQFQHNGVSQRSYSPNGLRTCGVVLQDKPRPQTARVGTKQPDPVQTPHRAEQLNTDRERSQNTPRTKWRAVKVTSWINPLVKTELERTAKLWGVSLSKVMAVALEEWVHQSIYKQHDAMLFPMIRSVIREELRAFGDRIVHFLMRIATASEATRILIANVLDRMLFDKADEYTHLIERSDTLARQKVLDKIPQMKPLIEKWNAPEEREGKEVKGRAR